MLKEVTQHILDQLPIETKLNDTDIAIIHSHKDFLSGIADDIVKDFYDTLFSHKPTAAVFHEGERPTREKSLKDWLLKTVTGDFSSEYWEWQTFVGILHIKRKVTNNMMIAMMGRLSDNISSEAIRSLPPEDAIALKNAWTKLASTVLSLIGEGYHVFYMKAVSNTTGLPKGLLENTVKVEIDNLIDEFKKHRM